MPETRTAPSTLSSTVDLDQEGKYYGHLRLPHSVHRSAYGFIPIPIVSIRNGEGPCVVLMAGNHGDEYEGQVALSNLARTLEANQIQGQIIMLPMANAPAARAGLRTSPIDDGNLNRCFPGDPHGTPTQAIAHYIESTLLARADHLLDLHSGGSSMRYRPTVLMAVDDAVTADQHALIDSLGFEQALVFPGRDAGCYSSSAARRQGATGITAEIAGGGNVDAEGLAATARGLHSYLHHVGVLAGNGKTFSGQTRIFEIRGEQNYLYAPEQGLFEAVATLGQRINAGDLAARIHFPESPGKAPLTLLFETPGEVVCVRIPARVEHGDCLFEIAWPV